MKQYAVYSVSFPAFWKYYKQYQTGQINISEFSRLMDCSRASVYKYIRVAENGSAAL